MAGTGIKGYTGVSSDGKYNIVNGQIVSTNPSYSSPAYTSGGSAIANRNGAVMTDASQNGFSVSDLSTLISNQVANAIQSATSAYGSYKGATSEDLSNFAKSVSNMVSESNSDYADMIREILANQNANTAQSQAFAREQMQYQTRSDQAAMAWSAQEAQKNRDWQEQLSDQAHQREVKDLMAAGLNPILSANGGAYTGSGATGQGFSSSGAMGNVDTSGTGAVASLMATAMNTASQAAIARLYTEAERYSADQNLAASKYGADASILNNQNTTSAQKQIAAQQIESENYRTGLTSMATKYAADKNLAAAGATAGAMKYSADRNYAASTEIANINAETQKWMQEHNWNNDPLGYITGWFDELGITDDIKDIFSYGIENPSHKPQDYSSSGGGASHRF